MSRDAEYWGRKEHFEKYGTWPATPNQEKKAIAKNKGNRELFEKMKNSNLSWVQDLDKKNKPEEPEQPTLF